MFHYNLSPIALSNIVLFSQLDFSSSLRVTEVGRIPSFRDSSLAWVIDEVGQYVARSNAKIENLRAIVEIAKVQDRFRHRVDLAPSDIREVVTRRVLSKKEHALPQLHALYQQTQGRSLQLVVCKIPRAIAMIWRQMSSCSFTHRFA
jgi:hypothetical protein